MKVAQLITATLALGMAAGQALSAARASEPLVFAAASASALEGRSHFAMRDGQRIHIWEKSPAAWAELPASKRRAVVFVHGGTYSGRPDFDLQVRDYSVMDAFARDGWASFAVDAQGYGASDDPLGDNWCRARDAAKDLHAAIETICALRGVESVSLLGWSWGVQVAGEYAQAHPERVDKLVLQGGTYRDKFEIPVPGERFRTSSAEGAAGDFIEGCFEEDVVEAYVKACLKHDPASPNGLWFDYMLGSDQVLQPAKLPMPTLLILGEHESSPERIADLSAFLAESAATHKRLLILPGGGHAILLEKPHLLWQREIKRFFGESWDESH